MLVLSRKEKQVIRIGHDIEITITQIKRNVVQLGISAPREVTILRGELAEFRHHLDAMPPPMELTGECPCT